MAIRPVVVDKRSPFLGEACALCKQPFAPGDELAICPEDATRHHARCWHANGNKCTAYGCRGRGEIAGFEPGRVRTSATTESQSKVQTLPARGFHCAQSCLVVAIAIAVILFAVGCFGLWAIADYIMIEVLGWHYRDPAAAGLVPSLINSGADLRLALSLGASLLGLG